MRSTLDGSSTNRHINSGKRPFEVATIALCALLASSGARAQVQVYTNYEERIGSRSTPSVQETDAVFGARTNIATGGISFSVPVLSIPGNNGPDISVNYKLGVRKLAGTAHWYFEEDEPHLSGSFSDSAGWTTQYGGSSRCSNASGNIGYGPPNVPSSNGRPGWFYTHEYWSGYFLSLPRGGGRLNRSSGGGSNAPTEGGPYFWATNDFWYFSCTPLSVGAGEGFVGHSPDGLKYHFNIMRDGPWLPALNKLNAAGSELELYRDEIRIYAGKIEDRFGNYVTGLTASDGRNVVKTVSGSEITYTYGTRQWVIQTAHPFKVTYPDGSVWSASVSGTITDAGHYPRNCPSPNRNVSPASTVATITSPSGATGVYTLKQVLIGYSYSNAQCINLDDGGSALDRQSVMASEVLVKRVVSGPGLASQTLNIDYGPANDCYPGSFSSPNCTAASPTWRTITYSYSDNRFKRYTVGNRTFVNADLILKLEEGPGSGLGPSYRTTEYEYSLMPRVGAFVGELPYSVGEVERAVLVTRKITQDGRTFSWKVPSNCGGGAALCLDEYGRPTKVINSSSPAP